MKNHKSHMFGFGTVTALIGAGILILVTGIGLFIQNKLAQTPDEKKTIKLFTKKITPMPTSGTIEVETDGAKVVITATDATDAKLDSDMSAIDASINAINAESINIDAGLNDTMGDLSE